jgi:hypothetical protein
MKKRYIGRSAVKPWPNLAVNLSPRNPSLLLSRLIHLFTRLWTTSVCAPDSALNSVGRFFPSGSKHSFSVSSLIS